MLASNAIVQEEEGRGIMFERANLREKNGQQLRNAGGEVARTIHLRIT
jgi:hypothetical protein